MNVREVLQPTVTDEPQNKFESTARSYMPPLPDPKEAENCLGGKLIRVVGEEGGFLMSGPPERVKCKAVRTRAYP